MAKRNRSKGAGTPIIGLILFLFVIVFGVLLVAMLGPDATSEPARSLLPTQIELPTLQPTSPPTDTAIPTELPTPTPTESAAILYFIVPGSAQTCPRMDCNAMINYFQDSEVYGIRTMEGEEFADSTEWWVVTYAGQDYYIHSSYLTREPRKNTSFQLVNPGGSSNSSGVQQAPQAQSGLSGGASVPGNCPTAVAMELSAELAAQYPSLDRDHDGKACYGD